MHRSVHLYDDGSSQAAWLKCQKICYIVFTVAVMHEQKTPEVTKASILVRPKDGVLDPAGEAVERALRTLGFDVSNVRLGRIYDLAIEEIMDSTEAITKIGEMCAKGFLVNPLTEKHEIRLRSNDSEQ